VSEREALEDEAVDRSIRRMRLIQLGVVAVVVVVVAVAALATGGGGGGRRESPREAKALPALITHTVAREIGGIPQSANALGSPTAPVTLQYFGDLQCPICKEFTLGALPAILQRWVKTGRLRVEYRSLETATREPRTFEIQQIAALAAGKQNKLWNFVETFYHEQGEEDSGYVTEKYLRGIAEQVGGLDLARWTSDRRDTALLKQVERDASTARNVGFAGTPSFLIGSTGGMLHRYQPSSLTEPGPFDREIERLLRA
jgi:protein-disulfide isomerase